MSQEILQQMADAMLEPYFDGMPSVPVFVKDDPYFKTQHGTAAFWDPNRRSIYVRPDYMGKNASFDRMIRTLKHELIHAWVTWKGHRETVEWNLHGPEFIKKAHQLKIEIDYCLNQKGLEFYNELRGKKPISIEHTGTVVKRPVLVPPHRAPSVASVRTQRQAVPPPVIPKQYISVGEAFYNIFGVLSFLGLTLLFASGCIGMYANWSEFPVLVPIMIAVFAFVGVGLVSSIIGATLFEDSDGWRGTVSWLFGGFVFGGMVFFMR